MQQLILFRHARAEKFSQNSDDHNRKATTQGRADALAVAKSLVKAGANPEKVLVSTAKRCIGTWEEILPCFPLASIQYCPELYLANQREIMEQAQKSAKKSVMIIGHNPGLKSLVQILADKNNITEFSEEKNFRFPPAAAAMLAAQNETLAHYSCSLFLP